VGAIYGVMDVMELVLETDLQEDQLCFCILLCLKTNFISAHRVLVTLLILTKSTRLTWQLLSQCWVIFASECSICISYLGYTHQASLDLVILITSTLPTDRESREDVR
jgi:hypothetical protein